MEAAAGSGAGAGARARVMEELEVEVGLEVELAAPRGRIARAATRRSLRNKRLWGLAPPRPGPSRDGAGGGRALVPSVS